MSNEPFDDTKKLNMVLAHIQELESNTREQAKLLADTVRRVEDLTKVLQDDLKAFQVIQSHGYANPNVIWKIVSERLAAFFEAGSDDAARGQRPRRRHIPQTSPAPGCDSGRPYRWLQTAIVWFVCISAGMLAGSAITGIIISIIASARGLW